MMSSVQHGRADPLERGSQGAVWLEKL